MAILGISTNLFFFRLLRCFRQEVAERVHEVGKSLAVLGRNGVEGIDAEAIKVRDEPFMPLTVHLIQGIENGLTRGPEPVRYFDVSREQALFAVHEEDDEVGLLDGERGLLAHLRVHDVLGLGLEPAGIHEEKVFSHPLGFGVVPVPRHSGHVIDDGEVPADDPVKESGFADIRTAYYGDNWFRHDLNIRSRFSY